MSQPNKFLAAGLKNGAKGGATPSAMAEPPTEAAGATLAAQEPPSPLEARKPRQKPSRAAAKHVGGYYDPAVSLQLRKIGLEEDKTVQDLVAEALDLLFHSRQLPPIAMKPAE